MFEDWSDNCKNASKIFFSEYFIILPLNDDWVHHSFVSWIRHSLGGLSLLCL